MESTFLTRRHIKESHSAKASGERPVYKELLKEIDQGKFNGVLTWAPDRLSRNAGDLGSDRYPIPSTKS